MAPPFSPFDHDAERRRIEEEHRRDLELLEAARRSKLAALEAMQEAEARRAGALASTPPIPSPAPAAKPRRKRAENYAAFDAVVSVLDRIEGDLFDRNDLLRQMETPPERSSLYKALDRMVDDKLIAIDEYGSGRCPTRYRLLVDRSQLPRP